MLPRVKEFINLTVNNYEQVLKTINIERFKYTVK